jgi:two-component system response regulator ResD
MKNNFRVLVVDDEDGLRALYCQFLMKMGLEVECAANGAEAMKIFLEKSCDAVLTDIQMPIMGGIMLASEIKRKKDKTVVIMMSGDRKKMMRAKNVGDYFLEKPFGLMEMYNLLVNTVESELQSFRKNGDKIFMGSTWQNRAQSHK